MNVMQPCHTFCVGIKTTKYMFEGVHVEADVIILSILLTNVSGGSEQSSFYLLSREYESE